jgi:hypothetical protein
MSDAEMRGRAPYRSLRPGLSDLGGACGTLATPSAALPVAAFPCTPAC